MSVKTDSHSCRMTMRNSVLALYATQCSRNCKIPSRLDVLSVVSRVETMLQISPWVRTDSDDLFSLRQLQRTQQGFLSLRFGLKYYSWQTCAGVRRHRHISAQHEAVLHMLTQFDPSLVTRFPPFVGNQTNCRLQKHVEETRDTFHSELFWVADTRDRMFHRCSWHLWMSVRLFFCQTFWSRL